MEAEPSSTEYEISNWMVFIKKKISKLGTERMGSYIYKLPSSLRKVDHVDDYGPCIVSIGPFHSSTTSGSFPPQASVNKDHTPAEEKDKWQYVLSSLQQTSVKKHDHLLAMEEHKWWYMIYLLKRMTWPNSNKFLEQVDEAISIEMDHGFVRRCYAESIKFESDELAAMVVVDGCFILELFFRFKFKDFTLEDPIFHNSWMVPTLRQDLALLENQIPFYILEKLFGIFVRLMKEEEGPNNNSVPSITDLALFFCPYLKENEISEKCIQLDNHEVHFHLLDLLHKFYFPTEGEKPSPARDHCITVKCEEEPPLGFAKCATELSEAGIEIKKGDHLQKISFSGGVLTIPPLRTDATTKSLLRNLIAFEQCQGNRQQHITTYALLTKSLIYSSLDTDLLQNKKIFNNDMGGVKDVLTLFNNIPTEVVQMNDYFIELCKKVDEYQMSCCHRYRLWAFFKVRCHRYFAVLKRDYFFTPRSFISFAAACVLLILTIFQTNYAARADRRA